MEKGNTKQQILETALELFSVKGFEATSISQIADAVGIRKASLYSHFSNKQEILDTMIAEILEQYQKHSIFANANWEDPAFTETLGTISPERVIAMVKGQVRFIIHDPQISKGRKMLVIEQFQNEEISKLQTKQNYTDVLKYYTGMMKYLIRTEVLRGEDPEMMGAQFCFPITVWINLCDREPERENEVMELIERHVLQFFRVFGDRPVPAV